MLLRAGPAFVCPVKRLASDLERTSYGKVSLRRRPRCPLVRPLADLPVGDVDPPFGGCARDRMDERQRLFRRCKQNVTVLLHRTDKMRARRPGSPGRKTRSSSGMSSVRCLSAQDTAARTSRESDVVARAIARHQREAASQKRTEEASQMETLRSGISEMVRTLARSHQQSNAA